VGKRLLASPLRPVASSATHPRSYLLRHKGGLGLGRVLAGACLFAAHFGEHFFNWAHILLEKSRLSR